MSCYGNDSSILHCCLMWIVQSHLSGIVHVYSHPSAHASLPFLRGLWSRSTHRHNKPNYVKTTVAIAQVHALQVVQTKKQKPTMVVLYDIQPWIVSGIFLQAYGCML